MFGLPKSTEINKQLPKKAVFDKFKPNQADRKLFDEQINRMAIVSEISPQTVSIAASEDVSEVYVVLITLKTAECNKRNIALLSKLIDQRMLFALQYNDMVQLAVYRSEKVLMSESKPFDEWKLNLSGLDLGAVWENIIALIGGIDLTGGKDLDESIAANDRREKLLKQIAVLEEKAWTEKQPKKKFEIVQQIKRLMSELTEE
jgi:hypothetical protein